MFKLFIDFFENWNLSKRIMEQFIFYRFINLFFIYFDTLAIEMLLKRCQLTRIWISFSAALLKMIKVLAMEKGWPLVLYLGEVGTPCVSFLCSLNPSARVMYCVLASGFHTYRCENSNVYNSSLVFSTPHWKKIS